VGTTTTREEPRVSRHTIRRPFGEPSRVKFPAPIPDPSKVSDKKIDARIAAHRAAVEKAARVAPSVLDESGKTAIVAGMKRSVEQIEALEAEQTRRAEDAKEQDRRFLDRERTGPWRS